jgi:hypothetical protein
MEPQPADTSSPTKSTNLKERPSSSLMARIYSPAALDLWWVRIPARLRRYSVTLSAAWADGIYLTAWPRLAVSLSIVAVVIGCSLGAAHWSPYVIGDGSIATTGPIIVFAESLPFLFVAAILGSLSAHLGVMLTLGYVIGDYLIAGPAVASWGYNSAWPAFFGQRLPLLLCYWLLFILAARTTITSNSLAASLLRTLRGKGKATKILRVATSAAFQFALVYAWTLATPMIIRVLWIWIGRSSSPLSVPVYTRVTDPWLPVAAAGAILFRSVLASHRNSKRIVAQRVRELQVLTREYDTTPALPRRIPLWARCVIASALITFIVSGFLNSATLGVVMFFVFAAILMSHTMLLPRTHLWRNWSTAAAAVPSAARVVAATFATFLVTRLIIALPAQGLNPKAGAFALELLSITVGIVIFLVFLPEGKSTAAKTEPLATKDKTAETFYKHRTSVLKATSLLFVTLLTTSTAHASCQDPVCCFVTVALVAVVIAALLFLLWPFISSFVLQGSLYLLFVVSGPLGLILVEDEDEVADDVTEIADVTVGRWGRDGLEAGDWVMKGGCNLWNYIFSGKWDPNPLNWPAAFDSGEEFTVPANTLSWPSGWEFLKGIVGQRIYDPGEGVDLIGPDVRGLVEDIG